MKVEATVDVGQNLASLLERLAQQIGTTADKVFPWYVQQAYTEGWTTLAAFPIVLLVLLPTFFVSFKKADFVNGDRYVAVCLISGVMLLICSIVGTTESVGAVRQIINPNYYAMTMLTRDIGRLTAR
jgi:protein-S-isoprenylcysteine O-methyltransferase Ste14